MTAGIVIALAAFVVAVAVRGQVRLRKLVAVLDRGQRLANAQEIAQVGSWEYDFATHRFDWSDEMYRLFGLDPDDEPTAATVFQVVHPDDRDACRADLRRAMAGGQPHDLDYRVVRPDGSTIWVNGRGAVTRAGTGGPETMSGTVQDITDRRRTEEALRESEAELRNTLSLLNATLHSTADGILVVDLDGRITSHNARFAEMWGIPGDVLDGADDATVLGHVIRDLEEPDRFLAKVNELYEDHDAESHDTISFTDGRIFDRYSLPQRVDGTTVGRVWSFRDVTVRTGLERELAHQAFHDSLTGLANQSLFRDRLDHAIARRGEGDGQLSVLWIDIDDFKDVNDSLGHAAGDRLLVLAAERLGSCLRASDTAARLGGDEFAVLLEDFDSQRDTERVARRILETLREPITIDDHDIVISASIGIADHAPSTGSEQLVRNADLAMYSAKRKGKNRFERYAATMHEAAMERIEVLADLRAATSEASCACCTNRSSTSARTSCTARKRWCAGSTPSVACSPPTRSSPSPRRAV